MEEVQQLVRLRFCLYWFAVSMATCLAQSLIIDVAWELYYYMLPLMGVCKKKKKSVILTVVVGEWDILRTWTHSLLVGVGQKYL